MHVGALSAFAAFVGHVAPNMSVFIASHIPLSTVAESERCELVLHAYNTCLCS